MCTTAQRHEKDHILFDQSFDMHVHVRGRSFEYIQDLGFLFQRSPNTM